MGLVCVNVFDEGLDVVRSRVFLDWILSSLILLVDGHAHSFALRLLHDTSGNHKGCSVRVLITHIFVLLVFRFKELIIIIVIVVVYTLFVELFVHALVSNLGFLDLEFIFGVRGQEKIVLIIDNFLLSGYSLEDFCGASFDEFFAAFVGAL